MRCSLCKKKTDINNSIYTKDRKSLACNICIGKLLKKSRCCLCKRKISGEAFTYFRRKKFMCSDCIKLVKKVKGVK